MLQFNELLAFCTQPMQIRMQVYNSRYFNICSFSIKLLALLIFCFLAVSCPRREAKHPAAVENPSIGPENALNLNTAGPTELEKLPGIGDKSARKIIEHREKYGRFRRPEHLILVEGFSEQRFRRIRNMIKTE
jgi:competence ComEA-like helix-hairpin-helix protein